MTVFRLQSILDLRQRDYEAAITAWSRAKEALSILDERIAERAAAATSSDDAVRGLLAGGRVDVEAVLGHGRDNLLARAEQAHLADQRTKIVAAVDAAYQVVLAARSKVAALEKLKERQADAATIAVAASEADALHESILRDAGRTRQEPSGRTG